jgi:hypothetical protein
MNSLKCDKCGKFINHKSKYSYADIYDYSGLVDVLHRCEKCNLKYGNIQSNAKPYDNDLTPYQGVNNTKKD